MLDTEAGDWTELLARMSAGDSEAEAELFRRLYYEMRRDAERCIRRHPPAGSVWATALVHEAYERLCRGATVRWESRRHFLRVAAIAMESLLIDHHRARNRLRRRPPGAREPLSEVLDSFDARIPDAVGDVLDLHDALRRLERADARAAEVVRMRFFLGLSMQEIADALGEPKRNVERDWTYARAWLLRELGGSG